MMQFSVRGLLVSMLSFTWVQRTYLYEEMVMYLGQCWHMHTG
jgi:hypothetical protein